MLNLVLSKRTLFTAIVVCLSFSLQAQQSGSPLASYSTEWNNAIYEKCNTAAGVTYMSAKEKEIIYILNLIRVYPSLFAKTVLEAYPERSSNPGLVNDKYYYQSLLALLRKMKPVTALQPDQKCYTSASCHALHSGQKGYVGHVRQSPECSKKKYYFGECCDYGNSNALDIVLSLLIDQDVPSLGHRTVCLYDFSTIGVSVQPHRKYGTNTVLDFH